MTEEVVVGRYTYRHEAEFAAGFLEDAGIPYRLQIDDPSLGMTLSSATIRVLAVDVDRALEVLELDPLVPEAQGPGAGVGRPGEAARRGAGGVRHAGARRAPPAVGRRNGVPPMNVRERIVSLLLGGGVYGVGAMLPAAGATLGWLTSTVAIAFGVFAIVGWAPRPVRTLTAALSGEAHP